MAKRKTHAAAPSRPSGPGSDSKTWAFLAYLLSVVGFVLVMMTRKNDRYAVYHAKQSLVLFLAWVVAWIIGMAPAVGRLISKLLVILLLVLWIMGMLNAFNGKQAPLPVLGRFADKINL